jgi:hypothetical protein
VQAIFTGIDRDGDRQISADELKTFLERFVVEFTGGHIVTAKNGIERREARAERLQLRAHWPERRNGSSAVGVGHPTGVRPTVHPAIFPGLIF